MDLSQFQSHRPPPNALSSRKIVPNDLMIKAFSCLPVKSLMRLSCMSKFYNSLISNPFFIKMHLRQSSRNPHLAIVSKQVFPCVRFIVPMSKILENTRINFPFYQLPCPLSDTEHCWLVGSCNGLLCYAYYSNDTRNYYQHSWLKFYNPATKVESKELAFIEDHFNDSYFYTRYIFGYDILTDMYKVVALHLIGDGKTVMRTVVRVFTLGDHAWRIIESFLVAPLRLDFPSSESSGVYFNGYVYWLALKNCVHANMCYETNGITIDQFVIMSLDLGTETHMQLLPPEGFDEVPHVDPIIRVLNDSLCFCHDFQQTHFVIWKMEKFGVVGSWTQLFKISYDLNILSIFSWLPLHISENNNTVMLANRQGYSAMIYNFEEDSVEILSNYKALWTFSKDHVESLVSIC
ncbi:hypothetical protein TSUD_264170 [Trifolium subterraneum]|uniref:Uncharacterized protein n=1 Tax=Trifolium subterraneum TaxID=3900 RepID=A0A2Z6N3C9_TRISU|nr:hypothetical protein TSUD_264170 [Trifolium subterraneum]